MPSTGAVAQWLRGRPCVQPSAAVVCGPALEETIELGPGALAIPHPTQGLELGRMVSGLGLRL